MKRLLAPLFFMLCAGALPQEDLGDFSVVDRLGERQREILAEILKARSSREQVSRVEWDALSVQLADILASPTYPAFVGRGAVLVDLKTDEGVLLTKDIHVSAHSLADKAGDIYLRNKDGKTVYKTSSSHVTTIEEVVKMHEPPLYYSPETPQSRSRYVEVPDAGLSVFTQFNLHAGLTRPQFTKDLTDASNSATGSAVNYELQAFSPFTLPFQLGANLMLETVTGALDNGGSYSYSALSLGPLVKFPNLKLGEKSFVVFAGARASVAASIKENRPDFSAVYKLAQTSLTAGFQRDLKLPFGNFVWGASLQRQWSKASSRGAPSNLGTDAAFDDSFGFFIGKETQWR